MLNNSPLINIDLTPEYRRNLKYLAKKYRNIRSDIQPLISELQRGNILGDRLAGFGLDIYIYKVIRKLGWELLRQRDSYMLMTK